jgi:hypothetical protein
MDDHGPVWTVEERRGSRLNLSGYLCGRRWALAPRSPIPSADVHPRSHSAVKVHRIGYVTAHDSQVGSLWSASQSSLSFQKIAVGDIGCWPSQIASNDGGLARPGAGRHPLQSCSWRGGRASRASRPQARVLCLDPFRGQNGSTVTLTAEGDGEATLVGMCAETH